MAQALYDQHPLDDYLKESWERRERLPGSFTEEVLDDEGENSLATEGGCVDILSQLLSSQIAYKVWRQWSPTIRSIFLSPSDDIAERFKYDLISSNLLSSSVSPSPVSIHPHPAISTPSQTWPGELKTSQQDSSSKTDGDLKPLSSVLVIIGVASLFSHHRVAALLALLMSMSFAKAPGIGSARKSHIPQMFEALDSLKTAGSAWDGAVNDAITIIEHEDRSTYYTPSSTLPSSLSALRVALHSTLLTTQQQCDNVRPLLAALASPMELSQLSEMYAPPSPPKPPFTLQTRPTSPRHKPASLPENNISGLSQPPASSSEKRQTWNGSYVNLVGRHTRTSSLRKKDRRCSDLSIFQEVQNVSSVAPTTPPRSPSLMQVVEEESTDEDQSRDVLSDPSSSRLSPRRDNFGTAALSLRRRRRVSGVDALGLSNARSAPSLRDSTHLPRTGGSRLTSISSTRHPLSVNALQYALHGALASRRYACSHLLALRFTEDPEDETYWENARNITGLLTSILENAAARLSEALAAADDLKTREGQPTPETSPDGSPVKTPDGDLPASTLISVHHGNRSKASSRVSKPSVLLDLPKFPLPDNTQPFAPVPNGISRFASHVDSISSSLNDAKDRLIECVQALRDAHIAAELQSPRPEAGGADPAEEGILETYERLRKELGFALRECERGKAALLDVFEARRMRNRPQDEIEEADDDAESSPGHRFHMLSGSSKDSNDRTDPDPLTPGDGSPIMPTISSLEDASGERYVDDVSQHLLLSTSSAHLPPPGLEQIFEGEVIASTPFNRERSKLSREERIRLMKEKRESMSGRGLAAQLEEDGGGNELKPTKLKGWGPGTDVVEELKDVIWKVGERRRKMAQKHTTIPTPTSIPIGSANVNVTSDGASDHDTNLCTA
ncbi:hypothetical protein A7U60_g6625 [Sanghuangporus baumii]|uniref:Myosin-binding domain-containing protein n=1 Tax=Sanghuangporus baumii TaxID=108892 RepID=A0A9Q5N748_SANBA|nr:hypothetical protein A7U60_g6625 [Sanghuangporus baumii]